MTVISATWCVIGASVGALHAWLLWRQVVSVSGPWLRLGLVGSWLTLAAFNGHLLVGAAGWAAGMLAQASWQWKRTTA